MAEFPNGIIVNGSQWFDLKIPIGFQGHANYIGETLFYIIGSECRSTVANNFPKEI